MPNTPLATLQRIFDAPVAEGGWEAALDELAPRLEAPSRGLVLRSPTARDPGEVLHNLPTGFDNLFASLFPRDGIVEATFAADAPGTIHNFDRQWLDAGYLDSPLTAAGSEFTGLLWALCAVLWKDQHQGGFIAFLRRPGADCFGPAEEADLRSLMPFLQTSIEVHRRLEWLRLQRDTAAAILDALPVGVVLTGDQGRVVGTNRVAGELLEESDGLGLDVDQLRPADPAARHAFADLLAHVEATGLGNAASPGGAVPLPRPSGRRALEASVSPIGRETASTWHADRPAAVTFLADPEREPRVCEARLQRLYGLTPTEARLAALLASGRSLAEAAAELGRSPHTVRKQLQFIFEKTEVRRQAELVRLLVTGVAAYPSE